MLRLTPSAAQALVRTAQAQMGVIDGKTAVRGRKRQQRPVPPQFVPEVETGTLSLVLEMPLPTTGCSSNSSGESRHWRGHAQATADYRAECLALLPRLATPMFRAATIRMEFFHGPAPGRYRAKDGQRAIAATCALVDAIVDAGILRDDCARYLEWAEVVIHGAKESGTRAGVVVVLTRMETK